MYASASDFDKYNSNFYLEGLSGNALQATLESMKALRQFALQSERCRRASLLQYFQQVPPFGDRCGNCDVCLKEQHYGTDAQRDLGPLGARLVLQAAADLNQQSMSFLLQALGATKALDSYRYSRGRQPSSCQERILQLRAKLPSKTYRTEAYFRELVPLLTEKKYLIETLKKATVPGSTFERSWTVYSITPKGEHALRLSDAVVLPVPDYLRELERKEEETRQRTLAKLEEHGISKDSLPPDEVKLGDGEVVRAFSKWFTYLENMKKHGHDERHTALEQLFSRIEEWRSQVAVRQSLAPASVAAEHTLVAVAYATATLPRGHKLDAESLVAAGIRSKEIAGLVDVLGSWVDQCQPSSSSQEKSDAPAMVLAPDSLQGATTTWQYAVYKPLKKTGLAVWEASYVRFVNGESPETIAMTPAEGRKPIQVKTVVGHLLDAVLHGRDVDVTRLVKYMAPPNQKEWNRLVEAEAATGMDTAGDPESSGASSNKFLMTDLLRPIVGFEIADKGFADRSEEEKGIFGYWCDKVKWYIALRRVNYQPSFSTRSGPEGNDW